MLTPWLHSNLFVAGTTVRSDEMNTKLSGIATALQQYADHINTRVMSLPPNFTGNAALPEKTYINSIPYFNLAGDADLYSMAAFDASVQLAIQKAADAAASQAAALASENAAAASESQALSHKNAAATSEENAASSASTATTKAGEAAGSATNAASSASSANTSATNAAGSASAASGSASAASGSASNAASSATAASGHASAANTSATNAAGSASAANTSATNANNAKVAAEAAASAASSSADDAEYWAGQAQTGGQQVYKGLWNASSNTFPSATTMGWTYKVSAASTASMAASNFTDATARFLNTGDTIIWNAPLSKWDWYADAASGLTPTAGRTDATAGRVIRAGDAGGPSGDYRIAGIDTANLNTTTSWNSITGVGVFKEPLRGNNTGGPGGTGGYVVQNIQASASTLIQFAHPISANSGLSSYVRVQVAGAWGAWRQLLDSANLSQFVQSSQTDATAGKLMPVGAFGLGASTGINLSNIDDITLKTGFYNCVTATTGTKPGGFTTNLVVMVHQYDADQVAQIAIETTTGRIFFRVYALTGWLAWQEFWHAGSKPTTLAGYGITDAVPTSRTINGVALSANIALTAANVGARADTWVPTFAQVSSKPTTLSGYGITDAVPTTRTINGVALSSNVSLIAANVGARADTWVPSFSDVTGKPTTLSGYGITDAATQTSLNTARTTNANATLARTGKVTYLGAVSDTANLTITIPTGYSAGDRIELSISVAAGRTITLSSVTSMAVVNGTAGTSHTITGPIHMNVVMIHDGSKWQLTVS